jgi:hypothetical protein
MQLLLLLRGSLVEGVFEIEPRTLPTTPVTKVGPRRRMDVQLELIGNIIIDIGTLWTVLDDHMRR